MGGAKFNHDSPSSSTTLKHGFVPRGGHKLNSREPNITRGDVEQEKGGSCFDSMSQESVWQVRAHTRTQLWLQRERHGWMHCDPLCQIHHLLSSAAWIFLHLPSKLHPLLGNVCVYLQFELQWATQGETTLSTGMLWRRGHARTRQASVSLFFFWNIPTDILTRSYKWLRENNNLHVWDRICWVVITKYFFFPPVPPCDPLTRAISAATYL